MSRLDKPKEQRVSVKEILYLTSNGIDLIKRYTHLKRKGNKLIGRCCFHNDRSPSMVVNPDTGRFVCYGCGKTGDSISLIMDKMGMEFQEALRYIVQDLNLNISEPIEIPEPVRKELSLCSIDFVDKRYTRLHNAYMNAGGLYEDHLTKLNIFAVDKWAINGKLQPMAINQYSFAYWDEPTGYVKILNLNVPKDQKWRNSAPRDFLWHFPNRPVEDLFIEKSNKDNALNFLLDYNGLAVNSENAENLIENMPRILEVCPNPIISFGSDPTDDEKANRVIAAYSQVRKFSIPKSLLRFGVNDKFEYSKHFGLKSLNKLIKEQL